ncbi:MAG: methyltransferase [Proteobacteria bacterium]|nr:MAG: methyltransferase [Pseudomonadota bacterium]
MVPDINATHTVSGRFESKSRRRNGNRGEGRVGRFPCHATHEGAPVNRTRRRHTNRRNASRGGRIPQLPWKQFEYRLPPLENLSADQLNTIHEATLDLLEHTGIEFMGQRARQVFREAGAEVDEGTGNVRLDRGLVTACLDRTPGEFTLTPRNPRRRLHVGGHLGFSTLVAGPPSVHDCERGRRVGNFEDYCTLIKLAQSFEVIHAIGNQPTAPIELPAESRHLDTYLANILYSDKVFHCSAIGAQRALDGIDMAAIARGLDRRELVDSPALLTIISVNSPKRFDEAMSDGLMTMAEWGQPVVVTPFTLMGAMAPATVAAALAQQNAEALAGICLAQIVRPGVPLIYGGFSSNVDMRTGSPAFGTPENAQATIAGAQLARFYGLPFRASNSSASNTVDAQAAYESASSVWSAMLCHVNEIYHGAGWMEGGLTASFEKIVLDVELLQSISLALCPPEISTDTLGIEAIRETPSGGHFFGHPHTLARYENAFYQPILSDWRNNEAWREAGALDACQRATEIWRRALEDYEEPDIDPAVRERLESFVARRKEAFRKPNGNEITN